MGSVVNPIGGFLGIGEQQGEHFQANTGNAAVSALRRRMDTGASAKLANIRQRYGRGEISLAQAISEGRALPDMGGDNGLMDQFMSELATDPVSGSALATGQVQSNPLLSQLFGDGGALSRTLADEQRLSTQGFQLQPEDHEAYGQASGNIARLFGQQEQSLAQALADRGLSQAPSGAAGVAFTGLAGNKNEQLARSQMDIANKRMENTMQRLNSARSFASQLGGQAADAINEQYQRQAGGVKQRTDALHDLAKIETGQAKMANDANYDSMQDKRGARNKTVGDAISTGAYKGTQSGVQSLVGGMLGGMG